MSIGTRKPRSATINLRAGRKAKASTAYASARAYFAAGMALLDERDWGSRYELTFSLWLERAECEFLSGNFEKAEQLIAELLQRAASKVDQAAVYQAQGPAPYGEVGKSASRRQRARVPAPVRHRPAGPPDLGAGSGRIRDGLAQPGGAPDREPDRPAADDRSGTTGRHAAALGPFRRRLLYRLPFALLAPVPHGEHQHAARDDRRLRARLWLARGDPRPRLSPLPETATPSASSLAILSRSTASSPIEPKTYLAMEVTAALDTTDRDRPSVSSKRLSRARTETGDLTSPATACNHMLIDLLLRGDPLEEVWRESRARA